MTETSATVTSPAPSSTGPVVTRFAPSPTGYLHIGGARTALFNWLYARGRGGRFLLRIEDTDRARSTPEATEAIYEGLRWLGLDWDGEAVSQFSRIARHAEVAAEMVARGSAYRCFATKEEVDAARAQAVAEKKPQVFRSPWRDAGSSEWPDAPYVVRLKAPREGETTVDDAVQGVVRWSNEQLDDLVLLRSDGVPTYMLAVVVDDHDMGVTHVIRGDDHLTNAARQTLIYAGMGWDTPIFGHIPLIHGPDGAKLSKRHGALGVSSYLEMGYLPEAMRNYLARLGWGHGDDEYFSTAQAMEWFDLRNVGKGAARFDFAKLADLNGRWMRDSDDATLLARIEALFATQKRPALSSLQRDMLAQAMPGLKQRAKTLVELVDSAYYILGDEPIEMDEKALKLLSPEARDALGKLTVHLEGVSEWCSEALEEAVRAFAEGAGVKLGSVAQPMRAALTGRATSPGVFDVLETLGREKSLARLRAQAS
jgi:glutamyl-tRNA synthetase